MFGTVFSVASACGVKYGAIDHLIVSNSPIIVFSGEIAVQSCQRTMMTMMQNFSSRYLFQLSLLSRISLRYFIVLVSLKV